ncbi:rhodanese-like domain-containing protein [Croceimicrobium sp.]|uniref:rhodanese-like domain-containing protein n=1 Tax=Croceimicrobium sp. TaxID=2828340 RepID=UPI003BAC3D9D
MNAQELIAQGKGSVVDVRSHLEFSGGHVAGSLNIPLDQINSKLDELRALEAPLILVCASGNRSGMAESFLRGNGIDCLNGGSWLNVNYFMSLREA